MLIIAGHFIVDAENRDEHVIAHQDMVRRARAFPGCLDLAITADPINQARINMFERWETEESLKQWRKVANAPSIDMREVEVEKYEISSVGPPF